MCESLEKVLLLKRKLVTIKEAELTALAECENTVAPLKERVQSSPKPGQDENKKIRYIELKEKSKRFEEEYARYYNQMFDQILSLNDELFFIAYEKYFKGRTWKEIAEDLDISYTTIMKRKKELCTLIQ